MKKTKIIAEIGVNHDGDVEKAKRLIEAAKWCQADAVKFQTFSASRLASHKTPKVPYQLRSGDERETHFSMLQRLELHEAEHQELIKHCRACEIEFLSTPYSLEDAALLLSLGVRSFKVASADIIDRSLHEYLAQHATHTIISTGMATWKEIDDVLKLYPFSKPTLLQCTSSYPCKLEDVNLKVIPVMRKRFQCDVGFSDHTNGNVAALGAVALGATIVEKHFTLHKTDSGPDHAASAEPADLKTLVEQIRAMEIALGSKEKQPLPSERDMQRVSRKSIVVTRDINEGEVLRKEDLIFMRPGTGISPMQYPIVVGRTVSRSLTAGEQINEGDLS